MLVYFKSAVCLLIFNYGENLRYSTARIQYPRVTFLLKNGIYARMDRLESILVLKKSTSEM